MLEAPQTTQAIDPMLVEAIKQKLRYWLVDRAGIFPDKARALAWRTILIESASDIRYCALKQAPIVALPPITSARSELWDWVVRYFGELPIDGIDLLPWAIALEEVAAEIRLDQALSFTEQIVTEIASPGSDA